MTGENSQGTTSEIFTRRIIEKNATAIEVYDYYRKVIDLVERANAAIGKKQPIKTSTGSTTDFEIDRNGISSTTA